MDEPSLSPDGLTPAQFQAKRRRPDAPAVLTVPIRGFGPEGDFTLFVPSPKTEVRTVFENGVPARRVVEGCLSDPRVVELRDKVILSMQSVGPGRLSVDFLFLEYTAAVLKVVYDLSDADLGFLLSGSKWHREMIAHALGGDGIISALSAIVPVRHTAPEPARGHPESIQLPEPLHFDLPAREPSQLIASGHAALGAEPRLSLWRRVARLIGR